MNSAEQLYEKNKKKCRYSCKQCWKLDRLCEQWKILKKGALSTWIVTWVVIIMQKEKKKGLFMWVVQEKKNTNNRKNNMDDKKRVHYSYE